MAAGFFEGTVAPGRNPDRTAIEGAAGERLTYGDLERETARLATALAAAGVSPGDRVAIALPKSIRALLASLAVMRAGAVLVPVDVAAGTPMLARVLHCAMPRVLLCAPGAAVTVSGVAGGTCRIETLDASGAGSLAARLPSSGGGFSPPASHEDAPAAILFTSGTTGPPKGAVITHGNIRFMAGALVAAWRVDQSDVLLHALPLHHAHGLFFATATALQAHAGILLLDRFDPGAVIGRMPSATVVMGVPFHYAQLLRRTGLRAASSGIRLFVSGSAPLPDALRVAFEAATGRPIVDRYGMTETLCITANRLDGRRRAGTVGPPLPGVELRITDPESGTAAAPGTAGMIEVRGPNLCAGYWEAPEATATAFRDGFFVTGDIGHVDDDGFLTLTGRATDFINYAGTKIHPADVETALARLDAVAEVAVFGVPHPATGEAPVAVVVLRAGRDDTALALRLAAAARLPEFMVPKRFVVVDAIPVGALGKVSRADLAHRFAGLLAGIDR